MIADASLSNAFDDLADLFLGGGGASPAQSGPGKGAPENTGTPECSQNDQSPTAAPLSAQIKPVNVEGLVLGHLPLMASLWASQYPRMAAAADNAPVALVRLDSGAARVEVFHPPHYAPQSRLNGNGSAASVHDNRTHALPDRSSPDLAGALSRAAQIASRIVLVSSVSADELLFARSGTVRAMAVLTGADDASAVGAYKAIKRLASIDQSPTDSAASPLHFRVAIMGSDEQRATAAFHRLADAAKSFLALPLESAGHCRQIAGGVPGSILFEGPSAMTTQAVLEALARPSHTVPATALAPFTLPLPAGGANESSRPGTVLPSLTESPAARTYAAPHALSEPQASAREAGDSATAPALALPPIDLPNSDNLSAPFPVYSVEAAALGLTPPPPPSPMQTPATLNGHAHHAEPAADAHVLPGLTPLSIRCPFDRDPVLAIDAAGVPQVITTATAGRSAEAAQQLLSVGAWFWTSRELLGMVCPNLRTDVQPVLHLVTDRPTDVKRLIDSDLRLHVRVPSAATAGTLALN